MWERMPQLEWARGITGLHGNANVLSRGDGQVWHAIVLTSGGGGGGGLLVKSNGWLYASGISDMKNVICVAGAKVCVVCICGTWYYFSDLI